MAGDFFLSHLCVSSLLWRLSAPEVIARSMMRLGLRHLELACAPAAPHHFQPGGENSRLFNVLAEAEVRPAVLRLTGLTYDQKLLAIEEAGRRRIPAVLDSVETLAYPDLIDRLRAYVWSARGSGVQYILENDFYTVCDRARAQRTLVETLRTPGLGLAIAPPWALAEGLDPADEVRMTGEDLRLAYLWNASPSMVTGHRIDEFAPGPVGEQVPGAGGRVDWCEYFKALAEVRFKGILNLHWVGADDWSGDQTEEAIESAIRYCLDAAAEAGLEW